MTKPIYVLNGPSLNRLGTREPAIYGTTTLAEVEAICREAAGKHTIEVEHVDRSGSGSLHVAWTAQLIDGAWVRWSKAKPEA